MMCLRVRRIRTGRNTLGNSLRKVGWSDRTIHDAVQVIAYFNYINRVADALGVEMEADQRYWGS